MNEMHFTLVTTCPAGHSFGLRRSLSTWRVSVQMPSVVLWCQECGLQWDAAEDDRATVLRVLTHADGQGRLDDGAK